MPLQEPKEILATFSEVMNQLSKAKEPLSPSEQHAMANNLSEPFNYLSAQVRKPGLVNVLHSQSAQQARAREEFQEERRQLERHREFIEATFKNADQYLRTIQLGGYAAFFAVWGFTRAGLPPFIENLSALLMTFSATVFVGWEIFKSTLLVLLLKRHASLGRSSLEQFIDNRVQILQRLRRLEPLVLSLARFRSWVWMATVVPASLAVLLLLVQFLRALLTPGIP